MSTLYTVKDHMFSDPDDKEERNTMNLALDSGALFKVHTQPVRVSRHGGVSVEKIEEGKYRDKPTH